MARVLIFANDNSTIYNFRRELLRRLLDDGHDVTLALPSHERNQEFSDMGCGVVEPQLSRFGTNPLAEFRTLISFIQIIRAIKPDVVLTYTAKPNIYGGLAASLHGVPFISTVTGLGAAFQTDGLLQRVTSLLQRIAYRRASRVFFQNSDNLATFQRLGIIRDRVEVLPGSGVNLDLHRFEAYRPEDDRIRFVTVARIRRDKGFDELFEAIRRLSSKRSDLEFHVVGWYEDDAYRDVVERMQDQFGVIVHGSVSPERVHDLITQSHCLIHPSHHEGMANVVLEAAAAGRPVLASDIPGCREAVENGLTGILFQPKDAAALVAAIEVFLGKSQQQRRAMGVAAREKMVAEFDREAVVDRYLEAIEQAREPQQKVNA